MAKFFFRSTSLNQTETSREMVINYDKIYPYGLKDGRNLNSAIDDFKKSLESKSDKWILVPVDHSTIEPITVVHDQIVTKIEYLQNSSDESIDYPSMIILQYNNDVDIDAEDVAIYNTGVMGEFKDLLDRKLFNNVYKYMMEKHGTKYPFTYFNIIKLNKKFSKDIVLYDGGYAINKRVLKKGLGIFVYTDSAIDSSVLCNFVSDWEAVLSVHSKTIIWDIFQRNSLVPITGDQEFVDKYYSDICDKLDNEYKADSLIGKFVTISLLNRLNFFSNSSICNMPFFAIVQFNAKKICIDYEGAADEISKWFNRASAEQSD